MAEHILDVKLTQGGSPIDDQVSRTADGEANFDVSIADSSTDAQVGIAIDISQLKLFYLISDQDVTLETNSGSAPDDTFALKAGEPLFWWDTCLHSNPLTADVTNFYFTNSSGAAAAIKCRTVQDSSI
jgi:hypothetical protein